MATVTYKCPNCGGGLIFNPQSQQFQCEYCMSAFSEQEIRHADVDAESEGAQSGTDDGAMALFLCPSCGAEIVADETTAATFCYYCHNPVVLSGRLDGVFRPEKVIPFVFDKEQATAKFLEWTGKKKFIPSAFFSKKQIEKITGVYFPYWVADCDTNAQLSGRAEQIRIWRSGDIEYTETKHFWVEREARIAFDGMTKKALNKESEAWVENIQPFQLHEMKDFNEAYLLGFQAEKRNVEKETLEPQLAQDIQKHAESMVRDSVTGYHSFRPKVLHADILDIRWHYTLFPVWILTYRNQGGEVYYYAMNGQTGKISGRLPIDKKKLGILSVCITAVCIALMMIGVLV